MNSVTPIYYGMLNPYEASILSLRPLHRGSVHRLWKSTLTRFLVGNGVHCNHITDKNTLVDMVFEMLQVEQQQQISIDSHDLQVAMSNNLIFQGHPQNLHSVTASATYTYTPIPDNTYEEEEPLEQCNCHECQQFEAPVPPPYGVQHILPTCLARNRGPISAFDSINQSNSDYDEEYFVDSNFCTCTVDVDTLLIEYDDFPADMRQTLVSMINTPIEELVEFLANFGVDISEGSRCRVYLITLLKDLLDEQRRALSPNVASALPANIGEASGNSSTRQAAVADLERMTQDFSRMMASKMAMEANENPETATGLVEDNSRECGICLQNPRQIAFVPCGHAICCTECARKLHACPVCRRRVHRRLRLYFS